MKTNNQSAEEEVDLPWMPLYIDKLISGTDHMDAAELGGYLRLLIEQFRKGHVTSDIKKLKKLSRLPENKLATVVEKFTKDADGNLQNRKCAEVREKQMAIYRSQKIRSSKGGQAKQLMVKSVQQSNTDLKITAQDKMVYNPLTTPSQSAACTIADLRKRSTEDGRWLETTAGANEMPADVVKLFCDKWITDAGLRLLHEKHSLPGLLGFMLDDMRKAKPALMPKKKKVLTDADLW